MEVTALSVPDKRAHLAKHALRLKEMKEIMDSSIIPISQVVHSPSNTPTLLASTWTTPRAFCFTTDHLVLGRLIP